jgi:hypothetical protein
MRKTRWALKALSRHKCFHRVLKMAVYASRPGDESEMRVSLARLLTRGLSSEARVGQARLF